MALIQCIDRMQEAMVYMPQKRFLVGIIGASFIFICIFSRLGKINANSTKTGGMPPA